LPDESDPIVLFLEFARVFGNHPPGVKAVIVVGAVEFAGIAGATKRLDVSDPAMPTLAMGNDVVSREGVGWCVGCVAAGSAVTKKNPKVGPLLFGELKPLRHVAHKKPYTNVRQVLAEGTRRSR
jgi:hypothetical protein